MSTTARKNVDDSASGTAAPPAHAEADGRCVSMSCRGFGISHDLVWAIAGIFTLCVILMSGE